MHCPVRATPEKKEEEIQEELWRELIDVYDVADKNSYGYATLINKLSEKYTITRKQSLGEE
jgi:hypothetical protein